jgi:H+-transporting ATPase
LLLQLSVGGFMTLFSARTGDKPFFSTVPAPILLVGAVGSLVITTLLASLWPVAHFQGVDLEGLIRGSYGIWPLWVWLWALVWFLIQDGLKVRVLRLC